MGALWAAAFVFSAKILVALREVAVAWRFGVSDVVDSYQISFTVVSWLPTLLWSVGTSVLVPHLVATAGSARRQLVSELNGLALGLGLLLAGATWIVGPAMARWIGEGLPPSTVALAAEMSRSMAPFASFFILASFYAIRLQARENFSFGLWEAAPAAAITLLIVVGFGGVSESPLVWGTLVGVVVQAGVLAWLASAADGGHGRIGLPHKDVWQTIYRQLGVMALGQIVLNLTLPIDQIFAARLGEGAVASLGYVTRLLSLATSLSIIVLGRALLPVLSELVSTGQAATARRHSVRWSLLMFVLGAVGLAIGWMVAQWFVALVYQRGAFTAEDSAAVAFYLRVGLSQLPFFLAGMVLVQFYASIGRFDILLWSAIFSLSAKLVLNWALSPAYGLAGIMVSTSVMYAVSFVTLLAFQYSVARQIERSKSS